jgi:uncharacterized membrane protein
MSVSGDGSVVVWEAPDPISGAADDPRVFRWKQCEQLLDIGYLNAKSSTSWFPQVSDDGRTVVGGSVSHDVPGFGAALEAFRWQESTGTMLALGLGSDMGPDYSWATASRAESIGLAVSADGNLVAGETRTQTRELREALWIWNQTTQSRTPIGIPADANVVWIDDMTPDGSKIVGTAWYWNGLTSPDDYFHYLWQPGSGFTRLDFLDRDCRGCGPQAISDDGVRIAANTPDGAAVWTQADGMRLLQDILVQDFGLGEQLAGWTLRQPFTPSGVTGMSADGQVLVGQGINPQGNREAWIAVLADIPQGDFDWSRGLDVRDIDLLTEMTRVVSPNDTFDLNNDAVVDELDRRFWVHDLARTWFGDANLDGVFNSTDLVDVFQAGQYEDAQAGNSTWSTGDWNEDGVFGSGDLVAALQDGGYEQGPRATVSAVPEPGGMFLITIAILTPIAFGSRSRRRGVSRRHTFTMNGLPRARTS